MTVTLADFVWAVRPTVSDLELTEGGSMTGSANWSAGVQSNASTGYAAWAQTSDLQTVTDNTTLVVVMDPNNAESGYRGMLSIPAYASGAHASPYHVYGIIINWTSGQGAWHGTIANTIYGGVSALAAGGALLTALKSEIARHLSNTLTPASLHRLIAFHPTTTTTPKG